MTNVGIRKYEKYLTQNLNDLVTGMININPDNSNLHFTIPLFSTISNCKMDFSLNYSYLSKYEKDGFGKGFKLSYYLKLYKENETMKMKLNDSSIIN